MSLHYLDPDREPRECHKCNGKGLEVRNFHQTNKPCQECHGTGRLGVEGAEPNVEVKFSRWTDPTVEGWFYQLLPSMNWFGNAVGIGFPTEAAALEAARKTNREQT